MVDKNLELAGLKNRFSTILSRGKTSEGSGVLRKIARKIRKLQKELAE
jgi:hypothetical protein